MTVYVTAFILLTDKIRHERLDFDTPPYTLNNVYLLLLLQLQKSIILRNLWNVTPIQGKVCIYFNPLNVKTVYFFTENVFKDSVGSVIEDSILAMHWVAPNATTRGVVQLLGIIVNLRVSSAQNLYWRVVLCLYLRS